MGDTVWIVLSDDDDDDDDNINGGGGWDDEVAMKIIEFTLNDDY